MRDLSFLGAILSLKFLNFLRIILWSSFLLFSEKGSALEEKIIFFHIPKTGGHSISYLLMNEYSFENLGGNIYSLGFQLSILEASKFLNLSEYKLITFLRDPVDRVLSEYKYCIEKLGGDPHILNSHRLPPGNPIETASNIACKMLSGLDSNDPSIPCEVHLEHAKRNLENFFFVGITEKMEESMELLFSLLGLEKPEEIPHFNKTETKTVFSEKEIEGIISRNSADIELYKYGLGLMFSKKEEIKKIDQPLPEFSSYIEYTFDQPLKGRGWGLREYSLIPNLNPVSRWVAEESEASVCFFLTPNTNYKLEILIFIKPIFCESFCVFINETRVFLQPEPLGFFDNNTDYKWVNYTGTVSGSLIKNYEKTHVILKAPPFVEEEIFRNVKRGSFACNKILFKPDTN